MDKSYIAKPASEQISDLAAGRITSADLLEAYLSQYEAVNGPLNAVIRTDLDTARKAAQEIDQRRSAGASVGRLQGLPMTIKDSLDVNGMPATCGVPKLKDRPADVQDADVIAALREADAVIWGKTNTPMMAGDVQTYNKVFGVTSHPLDAARSPGGSSGGAAAALVSHMTPLEVGSDIGGSLRNPAHFCGICSLKPSYGTLSTKGHVPPSPGAADGPPPDLAVLGPMARNMDDLILLMEVLSGGKVQGARDTHDLKDVRVAFWRSEPAFPLSQDCANAVLSVADRLKGHTAALTEARPDIDMQALFDTYLKLLCPIILSEVPGPAKAVLRALRPVFSAINGGRQYSLLSAIGKGVATDTEIRAVQDARARMKAACSAFFDQHDVLIAPVTPTPALQHNNKGLPYGRTIQVDGKTVPYLHQLNWIALATACHLPAAVLPVATTKEGLPIGIQLIGAEGSDEKLLAIAHLLEAHLAQGTGID